MADVRFITDNPFMRAWASGDERDRVEADSAQMREQRRQQIEASRTQLAAAAEERARRKTVEQASGQAAITLANPLERVVARQRPDMSLTGMTGGLDEQDVPRVTEQTTETVRPALRSRDAITAMAKGGAGVQALELARSEAKSRDAADDKFFDLLGKATDPAGVDVVVEWGRRNGVSLPEPVVQNKRVMAELASIAKTASQYKLPKEKAAELMRAALTKAGFTTLADAIPEGGQEDDTPHGQPFNLQGGGMGYLTKDGRVVKIEETMAPRNPGGAGSGSGSGAESKTIQAMRWKAKAYIGIGIDPSLADAFAANPSLMTTPAAIAKQARFIVETSKDIMGKPTKAPDVAMAEARQQLQAAQGMLFQPPQSAPAPAAVPPVVGPDALDATSRAAIERDMRANGDTSASINLQPANQPGTRIQGTITAPATAPAAAPLPRPAAPSAIPPQAVARLREGVTTRFANGQKWTLKNGQPVQVQ